jgi:hypothetical protein
MFRQLNFAFLFQFVIAALLAVAAAAPSSYKPEYKAPEITIVSQSDVRNVDGSGQWRYNYFLKTYRIMMSIMNVCLLFCKISYAGSDGTTRDESYAQKQISAPASYGKDAYGKDTYEKESGAGHTNKGNSYWVSPEGQRLTLTWAADEAGFQPKGEHLPVAPVHIPFDGKGFKIY